MTESPEKGNKNRKTEAEGISKQNRVNISCVLDENLESINLLVVHHALKKAPRQQKTKKSRWLTDIHQGMGLKNLFADVKRAELF